VKIVACFVVVLGVFSASARQQPQQQTQSREGNFDIRFEPTAVLQSNTEIRFDIKVNDALHKPVHGARVTLQIETPDHQGTKVFRATEMEPGLYMAKPTFPAAGRWNVYVEVRRDDAMSARTIEYYVNK
jgi:YtkA-like